MILKVSDLVNHLSGLPPMMPIMVYDSEAEEYKYLVTTSIIPATETDPIPILTIVIGFMADDIVDLAQSHDEKVADKRRMALDMMVESQKASKLT